MPPFQANNRCNCLLFVNCYILLLSLNSNLIGSKQDKLYLGYFFSVRKEEVWPREHYVVLNQALILLCTIPRRVRLFFLNPRKNEKLSKESVWLFFVKCV